MSVVACQLPCRRCSVKHSEPTSVRTDAPTFRVSLPFAARTARQNINRCTAKPDRRFRHGPQPGDHNADDKARPKTS